MQAFRHDVRVIPVYVGSMRPLTRQDLPSELAELAVCQYTRLGLRSLESDLDRLAKELIGRVPGLRDSRQSARQPGASGVPSISGITINGKGSQNAFGNTIGGDLHQERP
jgi:hypothetical protein